MSARPRWQRKPASAGYGTARAWDIDRVRALGAEPVVEADRVGLQLAPQSVHAVIDTIGGDALESACNVLRPNGVIVSVVRAPDETYLRSKGVRAAYFIVDVTRARLDHLSTRESCAFRISLNAPQPPTPSSNPISITGAARYPVFAYSSTAHTTPPMRGRIAALAKSSKTGDTA